MKVTREELETRLEVLKQLQQEKRELNDGNQNHGDLADRAYYVQQHSLYDFLIKNQKALIESSEVIEDEREAQR